MEREGEVGWKQQISSESTGKAGKATLGCSLPVYREVDVFYCKRICVINVCGNSLRATE